jgi:hypothetical protein
MIQDFNKKIDERFFYREKHRSFAAEKFIFSTSLINFLEKKHGRRYYFSTTHKSDYH